jgi:hypothetical protein
MTTPTILMLVAGTAGVTWVLFRFRSRRRTSLDDGQPPNSGEPDRERAGTGNYETDVMGEDQEQLRETPDEDTSEVSGPFTTQMATPTAFESAEQSLSTEPTEVEGSPVPAGPSEEPAFAIPIASQSVEQSLPTEAIEAETPPILDSRLEEAPSAVPIAFERTEQSLRAETEISLLHDSPLIEPAPTVLAGQAGALVAPADNSFPQSDGVPSHEDDKMVEESQEFEADSVFRSIDTLQTTEVVQATEAPRCEPLATSLELLNPPSDAVAYADESTTQAPTVNGKDEELGAPVDTAASNLPIDDAGALDDEAGSEVGDNPEPPLAESEPQLKARSFTEPKPSPTTRNAPKNPRKPDSKPRTEVSVPIRLQLVFGRGWTIRTLALVPQRREGMPGSMDVIAAHGRMRLSEWSTDSYEPIPVVDVPNALSEGVVLEGRCGGQRWRWELSRREIYVLAAGEEFGLHGFVTRRKDQRLWLNTPHVVLAEENLREQVLAALNDAGCPSPEVSDDSMTGVPSGWILFRDVKPTRAVPMRDERDILNVLCPAHEMEPQFIGGIRLERNVWLAGFPPRIRFNGEMGNGFQVLIDDQPTQLASDGAFESPGWDEEGDHRLWFGGRAETYSLRVMKEGWERWDAHDFGTGAAICGASTHQTDGARWRQVRIPSMNPLLIGARPGEVFCCQCQHGVRSEEILALVPFAPVWALPADPVHADKRSARLVALNHLEPTALAKDKDRTTGHAVKQWLKTIKDTGRKQLEFAVDDDEAKVLWRRYVSVAKQLWRKMR